MFCNKCGDPIDPSEVYCNKCGNYVGNINVYNKQNNKKFKINNKVLIGSIIGIVLIIIIIIIFLVNKKNYYFSKDVYSDNTETTKTIKGKYNTAVISDNSYSGVSITSKEDAYKLIRDDSSVQKKDCPKEIESIENQIINDYGITAVNLCEMDIGFAKEIANVFKKIYEEYPSVRGYITNISLTNASMSDGYIAAFMPTFVFASADTDSSYPWIIKTQILLNSTYFLNQERLKASVEGGSASGHFPPNATMYSPVAHELGHYLSFLALMKHHSTDSILLVNDDTVNGFYGLNKDFGSCDFSLEMIKEAYNRYINDTGSSISLDDWRGTISKYALAKDNNGKYIYDETIAESFHDVYLNGNNAKDASKYVISVLKEKLGS